MGVRFQSSHFLVGFFLVSLPLRSPRFTCVFAGRPDSSPPPGLMLATSLFFQPPRTIGLPWPDSPLFFLRPPPDLFFPFLPMPFAPPSTPFPDLSLKNSPFFSPKNPQFLVLFGALSFDRYLTHFGPYPTTRIGLFFFSILREISFPVSDPPLQQACIFPGISGRSFLKLCLPGLFPFLFVPRLFFFAHFDPRFSP